MEAWGLGKESDDVIYLRMRTDLHAELFCGFPLLIPKSAVKLALKVRSKAKGVRITE
jgi:hypothetical protein